MKLFLSPHNDDEALFGAFTIQREHPVVAVVFDSYAQTRRNPKASAAARRTETSAAMKILGAEVEFLGFSDYAPDWPAVEAALRRYADAEQVWAPAYEQDGHAQHNRVGEIAAQIWPDRLTRYMTYTPRGKSTGQPVAVESGEWIRRKLQALAGYETQIDIPELGCREHFMRDLREYYA